MSVPPGTRTTQASPLPTRGAGSVPAGIARFGGLTTGLVNRTADLRSDAEDRQNLPAILKLAAGALGDVDADEDEGAADQETASEVFAEE